MAARRGWNPFYAVVVVAGAAFCITACAYGVLTFRALRGLRLAADQGASMMAFIDRHGAAIMTAELLILGVATVGAISTDKFWRRREKE